MRDFFANSFISRLNPQYKLALALGGAVVALLPGQAAHAQLPGALLDPNSSILFPAPTFTSSDLGAFVTSQVTTSGGVTLISAVYQDSVNAGTYDFLYQVINNSSNAITGVDLSPFSSGSTTYQTYILYSNANWDGAIAGEGTTSANGQQGAFVTGDVTPSDASRTGAGDSDTISLAFAPSGIANGQSSSTVLVRTNATSYASDANAGITHVTSTNIPTFGPSGSAVPEPGSAALALPAVAGAFLAAAPRLKRRRK